MKAIAIIALVLGLAGGVVATYHLAETWPHVKRMEQNKGERRSVIAFALEMSYRNAAFNQVYLMWGLGGLGLILGVPSAIKARGTYRVLGGVGAGIALFALIVSLTTIMASRLG